MANVFPAHAGMSRGAEALGATPKGFPRSRGDEPGPFGSGSYCGWFSPLTRG